MNRMSRELKGQRENTSWRRIGFTNVVIRTQRLQYDVWGDTVNVASRMESTGEAGRIHVSEAFANLLSADPQTVGALTLIPRGIVDIKGKGAMQTLWLA